VFTHTGSSAVRVILDHQPSSDRGIPAKTTSTRLGGG